MWKWLKLLSRSIRYVNMGSYASSSSSSTSNVYPTSMTATSLGGYPTKSQDISFDPSLSTSNCYYTTNHSYGIPHHHHQAYQHQPHHQQHKQHHHHHTYHTRHQYGEPVVTYTHIQAPVRTATISSLDSAAYCPTHPTQRNRSFSASYCSSNPHVVLQHTPVRHQCIGRSANNLNTTDSYSNDFNIIEQYEARINWEFLLLSYYL